MKRLGLAAVVATVVLVGFPSSSLPSSASTSAKPAPATNTFSPPAFVDYKRFGGEPTVVVDRYPFQPGTFGCTGASACAARDLVYQSPPQGFVFPRYSNIFKSDDLGQTFRVPAHLPGTAKALATGEGGGDSHLAVGALTHKLFFIDLALDCITMNVSADLGENYTTDELGCGANLLDDRQWVDTDEAYPGAAAQDGWVYISAINLANPATPTLMLTRSTGNEAGVVPGSFAAHSTCVPATFGVGAGGTTPGPDNLATPCPDPSDPYLWVAGPVISDKTVRAGNTTHPVYIPFVRRVSQGGLGLDCPCPWQLYVAKSVDAGASWIRLKVADLPNTADPANIFVQMAIDRAGNLYYTWSQAQVNPTTGDEGEQDIYYTFSTNGGAAWASPIDLTGERGDSAVFPWMVAGDPGRVDLVFYKSNSGVNSNVAPPNTVWNTYFSQSINALNTGANFRAVQVSAEPNHLGGLCTHGFGCSGDRDLLDFITVDVDHLGAAVIAFSDDHQRNNGDARDKSTRQIAGNSVFTDQNITLQSSWPVQAHDVTDRAGDVYDGFGMLKGSCAGMDLLDASASRTGDVLAFSLTLNSAPSAAAASGCSNGSATGGRWGAEFWAAATGSDGGADGGNTFYVAYRDNPAEGAPGVEGGYIDNVNATVTSLEFHPKAGVTGTAAGTCLRSRPPAPCTLTMTIHGSALGITSGSGLFSLTGLSTYFFGNAERAPLLVRLEGGNSEQADATAAINYTGRASP